MDINIRVLDVSHRKNEPNTLHIHREKGLNAILFVHFLTPITINYSGSYTDLVRNSCIIYTPGVKHDYKAVSGFAGFENNYVTFETDTEAFLAMYKLPLNEPFIVTNSDKITACVEFITWASANRFLSLEKEIGERVQELFTLAELGIEAGNPKKHRDNQIRQRFIALRGEIMINPTNWTVKKMAAYCFLTRSRFYVLYESFFSTTPSRDLNNAKLEYAKERLKNSNDSIAEISKDCGYKRTESFIRMFKGSEGLTPGRYRKIGGD
jgi:AraC-like DNA-binding protein